MCIANVRRKLYQRLANALYCTRSEKGGARIGGVRVAQWGLRGLVVLLCVGALSGGARVLGWRDSTGNNPRGATLGATRAHGVHRCCKGGSAMLRCITDAT